MNMAEYEFKIPNKTTDKKYFYEIKTGKYSVMSGIFADTDEEAFEACWNVPERYWMKKKDKSHYSVSKKIPTNTLWSNGFDLLTIDKVRKLDKKYQAEFVKMTSS